MNELENVKEQLQVALFALNSLRIWDDSDDDEYDDFSNYAKITLDKIAEIQRKLKP